MVVCVLFGDAATTDDGVVVDSGVVLRQSVVDARNNLILLLGF